MRRMRSSFAVALGVRCVEVDLAVVGVVVGDVASQPVVLLSLVALVGVGGSMGVESDGEGDGDRLLATFVGGGEIGELAWGVWVVGGEEGGLGAEGVWYVVVVVEGVVGVDGGVFVKCGALGAVVVVLVVMCGRWAAVMPLTWEFLWGGSSSSSIGSNIEKGLSVAGILEGGAEEAVFFLGGSEGGASFFFTSLYIKEGFI
jgi:hypothetical protein